MPGVNRDTDDIRRTYRTGVLGGRNYPFRAGRYRNPEAEFDAWLARHDAEILEAAARYAERWAEENEAGGYARAAHSVAHAIRCGGVDITQCESKGPDE